MRRRLTRGELLLVLRHELTLLLVCAAAIGLLFGLLIGAWGGVFG